MSSIRSTLRPHIDKGLLEERGSRIQLTDPEGFLRSTPLLRWIRQVAASTGMRDKQASTVVQQGGWWILWMTHKPIHVTQQL